MIVNETSPRIEVKSRTYCAQGAPIKIPIPFSKSQPVQLTWSPVTTVTLIIRGTMFFYFITSVDYIAPATTQITVQLDLADVHAPVQRAPLPMREVPYGDRRRERLGLLRLEIYGRFGD